MFRPWEVKPAATAICPDKKEPERRCLENDVRVENTYESEKEGFKGVISDIADEESEGEKCPEKHSIDLEAVLRYKKGKGYPTSVTTKNQKSNFRRQSKCFFLKDDQLWYVHTPRTSGPAPREIDLTTARLVIFDSKRQRDIIRSVHEGPEPDGPLSSLEASGLAGHRGRDRTIDILTQRFFWHGMHSQARAYCRNCVTCQKVNPSVSKASDPLHPVGVPRAVMNQVGIDIASMPESQGKKYIVVAICYFSKWSEAEALADKSANSVAGFIFRLVTRHGCIKVFIHDQGREFVNAVQSKLCQKIGTKRRICSAYHPQSNGLVERQNRTIKNTLLKVLQGHNEEWPNVLDSVLFAHRVASHASTKFSPFYMVYQRQPVLPIDLDFDSKFSDDDEEEDTLYDISEKSKPGNVDTEEDPEFPFDTETFLQAFKTMDNCRSSIEEAAMHHIKEAQNKQKFQYDRRHVTAQTVKEGQRVLLINSKRESRKGDKSEWPKSGPYTVVDVDERKRVSLRNEKDITLKCRFPLKRIVPLVECAEKCSSDENSKLTPKTKGTDEQRHIFEKKTARETFIESKTKPTQMVDTHHKTTTQDDTGCSFKENTDKKETENSDGGNSAENSETDFKKKSEIQDIKSEKKPDVDKVQTKEVAGVLNRKKKATKAKKGVEQSENVKKGRSVFDKCKIEAETRETGGKKKETSKIDPEERQENIVGDQNERERHQFLLPDRSWVVSAAELLHVPTGDILNDREPISSFSLDQCAPNETYSIRGDGNCFFRCVSFLVSGSQNHFQTVRKKLVEFMCSNVQVARYVCNDSYPSVKEYIRKKKMGDNRTWATDAEIFAMAIMLNIDFFVYLNDSWQRFSQTGQMTAPASEQGAVFLKNVNGVHFEVVRSIKSSS